MKLLPAFSLFIQFSVRRSLTLNPPDKHGDTPEGYNEDMKKNCYFPDSWNKTLICQSSDLTGSTFFDFLKMSVEIF